ncbi:hypothetical protein HYH03_012899 [Edaphochlamys debaryana]|uniref:Protein kinase domain-containing protein n=1 Tax=Edaphochlamys debaryana TaxID=47281 RepID=A0A835XRY3_9CHLO|nr:hypothetical protein HYH03_012899 [Edaphochlamys debaryana]|eukprot:KAG2488580.1 hypothetical protein HYH03_012899 [Edaphochlamys debaryana]
MYPRWARALTAWCLKAEQLYAVKCFKYAHSDSQGLRLALREIRLLRSLDHPLVIGLERAFRSRSQRVYAVFPHIDGGCAQRLLQKKYVFGLPPALLKSFAWQLCAVVRYLHEQQVLHRDIKPPNVLCASDGTIRLCDFGFARRLGSGDPRDGAQGQLTAYVVTRAYRAPEVLLGQPYGAPADVWALGATLAELAVGRPLLPGTSSLDQLWHVLGAVPGPRPAPIAAAVEALAKLNPATLNGAVDPQLLRPRALPGRPLRERLGRAEAAFVDVVEACMRLEPADRASADQLLRMPYFADVRQAFGGHPTLERLYDEVYGSAGGPAAVQHQGLAAASVPREPCTPLQAAGPAVVAPEGVITNAADAAATCAPAVEVTYYNASAGVISPVRLAPSQALAAATSPLPLLPTWHPNTTTGMDAEGRPLARDALSDALSGTGAAAGGPGGATVCKDAAARVAVAFGSRSISQPTLMREMREAAPGAPVPCALPGAGEDGSAAAVAAEQPPAKAGTSTGDAAAAAHVAAAVEGEEQPQAASGGASLPEEPCHEPPWEASSAAPGPPSGSATSAGAAADAKSACRHEAATAAVFNAEVPASESRPTPPPPPLPRTRSSAVAVADAAAVAQLKPYGTGMRRVATYGTLNDPNLIAVQNTAAQSRLFYNPPAGGAHSATKGPFLPAARHLTSVPQAHSAGGRLAGMLQPPPSATGAFLGVASVAAPQLASSLPRPATGMRRVATYGTLNDPNLLRAAVRQPTTSRPYPAAQGPLYNTSTWRAILRAQTGNSLGSGGLRNQALAAPASAAHAGYPSGGFPVASSGVASEAMASFLSPYGPAAEGPFQSVFSSGIFFGRRAASLIASGANGVTSASYRSSSLGLMPTPLGFAAADPGPGAERPPHRRAADRQASADDPFGLGGLLVLGTGLAEPPPAGWPARAWLAEEAEEEEGADGGADGGGDEGGGGGGSGVAALRPAKVGGMEDESGIVVGGDASSSGGGGAIGAARVLTSSTAAEAGASGRGRSSGPAAHVALTASAATPFTGGGGGDGAAPPAVRWRGTMLGFMIEDGSGGGPELITTCEIDPRLAAATIARRGSSTGAVTPTAAQARRQAPGGAAWEGSAPQMGPKPLALHLPSRGLLGPPTTPRAPSAALTTPRKRSSLGKYGRRSSMPDSEDGQLMLVWQGSMTDGPGPATVRAIGLRSSGGKPMLFAPDRAPATSLAEVPEPGPGGAGVKGSDKGASGHAAGGVAGALRRVLNLLAGCTASTAADRDL